MLRTRLSFFKIWHNLLQAVIIFTIVLVLPYSVLAQPNWDYTESIVTGEIEFGNAIASDTINNFVYVGGTFDDRSAFGFPAGIVDAGIDDGAKDGFLSKYDLSGTRIWTVDIGSENLDEVIDVAVDPQGFIYVTGYSEGDVWFHSTDLSVSVKLGLGGFDIFIAKYSPAGVLQWANVEGGTGDDYGHSLVADNNAVYLTGVYDGVADFEGISQEATYNSVKNGFLAKYNQGTGASEWLFEAKSNGEDVHEDLNPHLSRNGLAIYDDTLYMMSYMGGTTMRFVNGGGSLLATPQLTDVNTLGKNLVINAIDLTGGLLWVQQIDNISSPNHFGNGITADCGGVYICGTLHDGAILPTIPAYTVPLYVHDKPYIAGLRKATGEMFWHTEFEHSNGAHVNNFYDISSDYDGNLYVTGTIDVSPIFSADTTLNAGGTSRTVVLNYHNNGDFQWARRSTGVNGDDLGYGITAFSNQYIFITGEYSDNFAFGGATAPGLNNEANNFYLSRMTSATVGPADPCNCILEDPSFSYSATSFCQDDLDPSPSSIITPGGTFSEVSGSIIVDPNSGLIDLGLSSTGSYWVVYTTSGAVSCPDVDSIEITINPTEDASFGYATTSYCTTDSDPSPSFITDPGGNFSEITGDLNVNGMGVIDISLSIPGTYYVVYTTGGPCPDLDSVQVTISDIDDPSFVFTNTIYCQDDTDPMPFSITTSGGTFSEVTGNISVDPSSGLIDLGLSSTGTYWVAYTTAGVCPDVDSIEITINPTEDASFGYATTSYCTTDSDPSPSFITEPGGSFSEITGDLNVNGSGVINISSSLPGTYYVVYTTGGPCPDLDSVQVTISDIDDPSFSYAGVEYCQDDTDPIPFSITTSGGTFSEVTGNINVDPSSGLIDLGLSSTGTYWVAYTTAGVCPDADSVEITINPIEDASFGYATTSYCTTDSDPSPSFITEPGGDFSEITGDLNVNGSGVIDISNTLPGTYYVVYTTDGPCPDLDSVQVTISDIEDPSFVYTNTIYCQDDTDPMPFSITTPGGTFSEVTGNISVDPSSGLIDLGLSSTGTYWVAYTTSGACSDADSVQITINAEDDASFAYSSATFCQADTDPTPSSVALPGGTFSEATGSVVVDSNSGLLDLALSVPGTFWITYSTSGVNCPNIDSVQVTIVADVDPTWTQPTSICDNEGLLDLTSFVTGTVGGDFTGAGVVSSDFNPIVSGPGIHDITYSVGAGSCIEQQVQQITVLGSPTVDIGDDFSVCGLDVDLSGNSTNGSIVWSNNSGAIFNTSTSNNDINITAPSYGTHSFYIDIDQSGVCSTADTINVTFDESPSLANAGVDQVLDFTFQSTLEAVGPAVGVGTWSSDNSALSFYNVNDPNTLVGSLVIGENQLIWTVANGVCSPSVDNLTITVKDLFIPQGFSPNDDGDNDFFEIIGIENVDCAIEVFNRWGNKVFITEDYKNDWGGISMEGNSLPNDTYYYIIVINNDTTYTGYIVLKK